MPNPRGETLCIKDTATVPSALKQMLDASVSSLPIVDADLHIKGQITTQHFVLALVSHLDFNGDNFKDMHWADYFGDESPFSKTNVVDFVVQCQKAFDSKLDHTLGLPADATLLHVAKYMAKKDAAHHVLIYDADTRRIRCQASASRVALFLAAALDQFLPAQKPLSTFPDIISRERPVATVTESTRVLEAFGLMANKKLSAIGVVDAAGELVGTVSLTDALAVGETGQYVDLLKLTTEEYLAELRTARGTLPGLAPRPRVVCAVLEDSLHDTLQQMLFYKVHRVFVIDHARKPIGVLSVSDVIRFVVEAIEAAKSK